MNQVHILLKAIEIQEKVEAGEVLLIEELSKLMRRCGFYHAPVQQITTTVMNNMSVLVEQAPWMLGFCDSLDYRALLVWFENEPRPELLEKWWATLVHLLMIPNPDATVVIKHEDNAITFRLLYSIVHLTLLQLRRSDRISELVVLANEIDPSFCSHMLTNAWDDMDALLSNTIAPELDKPLSSEVIYDTLQWMEAWVGWKRQQ